jgi:hypothetical protein
MLCANLAKTAQAPDEKKAMQHFARLLAHDQVALVAT